MNSKDVAVFRDFINEKNRRISSLKSELDGLRIKQDPYYRIAALASEVTSVDQFNPTIKPLLEELTDKPILIRDRIQSIEIELMFLETLKAKIAKELLMYGYSESDI